MAILYDARKIKTFETLLELCNYTEKSEDWANEFWLELLQCEDIYNEFVYYLEHHDFLDHYKIEGYSIIDMFIYEMNRYNLLIDSGKNDKRCDKEDMVLYAFYHMLQMKKDPEEYRKKLESDQGMDKMK